MAQKMPLMVPGAKPTETPLEIYAPYNGAHLATVPTVGAQGVDKALATAHRLYMEREAWLPTQERIHVLEKAAAIIETRAEELALAASAEGGKPLMDSRVEMMRAIDGVKGCVEAIRTSQGAETPMGLNVASSGRLAVTSKEPIGVVLAFSAFNHPFNLIVHQVGPAIAAGCPVIVKPAEATPLSCIRFVEILREAGLPEEWCQVIHTENFEVAGRLVRDERVAFFSFIGSGKVGWMLRGQLAPGTRCALEHGGAGPVVVAEDAYLEDALPRLLKGGFYHAGQVCVSVQRIFVHESIAREVAERLAQGAKELLVGDPKEATTEVGPLIRHGEVQRVDAWVKDAVSGGAELLCGGESIGDSCYTPTVLFEPAMNAKVSTQEIFGPVVCVYAYSDLDEAIERANSLPFAFQNSVFTQNIDTAMRCYSRFHAATVMVNDHTAFRVDWMPFAGAKTSGLGIGGIPYTLRDMQVEKQLVLRSDNL